MKQLLKRPLDHTFRKFILVGILNTLFGTGIMFLFYNVFHFGYWISSASNYFFGSILSYLLNRAFTFQNKAAAAKTLPRFVINISLCYLLAYGMAKPLVRHILSHCTQTIQDNIAMLVAMCLFVGLNYIGQRFFVFRESKTDP
jgi:putative flippase GtrA